MMQVYPLFSSFVARYSPTPCGISTTLLSRLVIDARRSKIFMCFHTFHVKQLIFSAAIVTILLLLPIIDGTCAISNLYARSFSFLRFPLFVSPSEISISTREESYETIRGLFNGRFDFYPVRRVEAGAGLVKLNWTKCSVVQDFA